MFSFRAIIIGTQFRAKPFGFMSPNISNGRDAFIDVVVFLDFRFEIIKKDFRFELLYFFLEITATHASKKAY